MTPRCFLIREKIPYDAESFIVFEESEDAALKCIHGIFDSNDKKGITLQVIHENFSVKEIPITKSSVYYL